MLSIVTWNINSVRLRMKLLERLINETKADVICLQEIKVKDALFPYEHISSLGYPHMAVHGLKGYHGVAILSKRPFASTERVSFMPDDAGRHVSVVFEGGLELHNFYIPAGGDVPDRIENPYYGYKLDFVESVHRWFVAHRKPTQAMALVGDLNIAPREHDVWSHKALLDVVSHTPAEVERLNAFYDAMDWRDAARHFTPDAKKLYSWWSYRNRDWKASNRGRRLDHIWLSAPLLPKLTECQTLTHFRDAMQPSDHVPVLVELQS